MEEESRPAGQGSEQRSDGQEERAASSGREGAWSDREIRNTTEDRFSFRDYAGVLARRASTADTPLTIGIYGRWGSGKSSLMGLTEEALPGETERGGRVRSIWINVWQLSSQDEVWQAFLQALFSEVHSKLEWWERVAWRKLGRQVLVSLARFGLVTTPLIIGWLIGSSADNLPDLAADAIAAGGVAATVGLLLLTAARIGPIVEAFRQSWKIDLKGAMKYAHYDEQISELRKLQGSFSDLVELLVGDQGRLVVFIDDLDRCTPDAVPEVLEAIKLFTTTPRCIYLIGLDRDVVRQGIQARYKFETETAATEYLEKIVQVPFHLPPLDLVRIEEFVREHYPDLQRELPLQYEDVAGVFSEGLEPNPRKVKRALNIYRTLRDLAETRVGAWEMDPVDAVLLAKMVVIESRFRPLHEYLIRQPRFLLDVEKLLLEKPRNEVESARNALANESEVGPRLFGTPKSADAEAQPGLLEEAAVPAFIRMLWAGERHFGDEDQRGQISSYIYLTGTAEGGAEQVRPSRLEREVLLRGEHGEIKKQVEEILERGADDEVRQAIGETYIARLETVAGEPERYTAEERKNAGIALALFELLLWGETDESRQARARHVMSLSRETPEAKGQEPGPRVRERDRPVEEERRRRIEGRLAPALESTGFFEGAQVAAANQALDALEGYERKDSEPETVRVPAGPFLMGSDPKKDTNAEKDEQPQHELELPAYRIGRTPVTNAEYRLFVEAESYEPPEHWEGGEIPEGKGDHPVVYVSWHDAVAYCEWLSRETGREYGLPSEAEWEKAARGVDGRIYPWGDAFDPALANTDESGVGGTSPVGDFPGGASPYGLMDMSGNVWEWTISIGRPYPYDGSDGREAMEDVEAPRALRGGSWIDDHDFARAAYRLGYNPSNRLLNSGFRLLVRRPPSQ